MRYTQFRIYGPRKRLATDGMRSRETKRTQETPRNQWVSDSSKEILAGSRDRTSILILSSLSLARPFLPTRLMAGVRQRYPPPH
jgi:hypothetical protein